MRRRDFLKCSSLLALGSIVPEFLARTAQAAEPGKDNVLVVLEMTGGNDGLNTVIPFANDRYYTYRPTLGVKKTEVVKVNDAIGLHPRLAGLAKLLELNKLAIVLGVGYPNPDRSHFESMDIWQSADPRRAEKTGWLARAAGTMTGGFTGMQVGPGKMPLALTGPGRGIISLGDPSSFELTLTGSADRQKPRRQLIEDLSGLAGGDSDDLTGFVQRRQLHTLTAVEKIRTALKQPAPQAREEFIRDDFDRRGFRGIGKESLMQKLQLVARLIKAGLGTRLFYVSIDGFDTHSKQAEEHGNLLGQVGNAIQSFFQSLDGDDKRVLLMTFSEFGRRVQENGSKGTDHGAASCLFIAGPAAKAGVVGNHPSLDDLDNGDLKFNLDFRRIYATLLDQWLGCDSRGVLNGKFEHVELLASKSL